MGKRGIGLLAGWVKQLLPRMQRRTADYGAILLGLLLLAAVPSLRSTDQHAYPSEANPLSAEKTWPAPRLAPTAPPTPTPAAVTSVEAVQGRDTPPVILEEGQRLVPGQQGTPVPTQARPNPSTRSDRYSVAPANASPQERFILEVAAAAQASQRATGVPASVTIAQAILESDSGRSRLAKEANNFFGIKASKTPGPAGVVYMDTWEYLNGRNVTRREPFKAYHTMEESFTDHGEYLRNSPIYAEAMKHTDDPRQFARQIHRAGYATDPQYATKLIRLMDRYNLYQYDS